MITKDQIRSFFSGPSGVPESDAIARYLETHPEVLKEFLSEEEWNGFVTDQHLPETERARIFDAIRERTALPEGGRFRRLYPWLAAAAAVLLILTGGWFFFFKTGPAHDAATREQYYANPGRDTLEIRLNDGSLVKLAPESSLEFDNTVPSARRAKLDGAAVFEVVHDTSRPFYVASGVVLTKVLGTRFLVRAVNADTLISVHLFTGVVLVQSPSAQDNPRLNRLQPGEILRYNKRSGSISVTGPSRPAPREKVLRSIPEAAATGNRPRNIDSNYWYMFNNQPLGDVLDQLKAIYHVEIRYSREDLTGMTFIGKLDKTDTLEQVLNYLSKLNGLKLSRENGGYSIRK